MDNSNLNQPREIRAEEIRITGIVQGVGFRPTVYRLAIECGLAGAVANDGAGVLIRVAGDPQSIDLFLHRLAREQPPLARIDTVIRTPIVIATAEIDQAEGRDGSPAVMMDSGGMDAWDVRSPLVSTPLPQEVAAAGSDQWIGAEAEDSLALGQRTAIELHRNRYSDHDSDHDSDHARATEAMADQGADWMAADRSPGGSASEAPLAPLTPLRDPLAGVAGAETADQSFQGQRCPLHLRPERRHDHNSTVARSPRSAANGVEQLPGPVQGQRQSPDRPRVQQSAAWEDAPELNGSPALANGIENALPTSRLSGEPLPSDLQDLATAIDPMALATDEAGEPAASSMRPISRSRLDEIFDTSPGALPQPSEPPRSTGAIGGDYGDDAAIADAPAGPGTKVLREVAESASAPPAAPSGPPLSPAIAQSLSDALAGELASLLEPAIDRLTQTPSTNSDFLDLADQFRQPVPPARPTSPPTFLSSPVAHRPQPINLSSGELLGRSATPAFRIVDSQSGPVRTQIAPDTATCAACLRDLNDPHSRFYRYPFVNCTHCGPRLTVIRSLPYDRARTSMAGFQLCADCGQDYNNPGDRRFHAQPTACPTCGPMVWFERLGQQQPIVKDDRAIEQAAIAIMQGSIVAIKGVGGVHLACDATQEAVVQRLRLRKHRPQKPLAVMVRNLEMARRFCRINDHERSLLTGAAAPIVLLTLTDPGQIAAAVAPGLTEIGVMLPYSPLHHLLMGYLDRPIVLTSGNRAGEPQCIDNQEARVQLQAVADAFLLHNRPILHRVDDSVVRVLPRAVQVLRRSRGYAPTPIALPPGLDRSPPILAMGNDLKNALCLSRDGQAVLSPYIGDLDSPACLKSYTQTIAQFRSLFDHRPSAIAVDSHPDGQSVKAGEGLAKALEVPLLRIQHHHAHIATCMVDNHWGVEQPPVLGIALDGMGWGSDGTIWGGELLWTTYNQSQRVGALRPARLLGGNRAAREPWRNLYAQLHAAGLLDRLDSTAYFANQPLNLIEGIAHSGFNSPWSSSCGRLFDAVAAFLGLWTDRISYEGQAAIALENLATQALDLDQEAYPIELLSEAVLWLNPTVLWEAMLTDRACGVPPSVIALRFHRGLAQGLIRAVETLHDRGLYFGAIACGGGVFQNRLLLTCLEAALTESPLRYPLLFPQQVPANDGGLALGQAAIAAAWMTLGRV